MSSVLFTRKPKPFDVSGLSSKTLTANKSNASKRHAVHSKSGLNLLLEDDDEDRDFGTADADNSYIETLIAKKRESDDDDVDDVRPSRRQVTRTKSCNTVGKTAAPSTAVDEAAGEESCSGAEEDVDEVLQQCRQLSARLESQRKKIKSDLSSQATSRPTATATQRSIVADDYLCSSRVLSASERLRQKVAITVGRTAHDAQNTQAMAVTLSAQAIRGQQSSLHHLKLVTRVNGLHEWKWSFAPDESFSKVSTVPASHY